SASRCSLLVSGQSSGRRARFAALERAISKCECRSGCGYVCHLRRSDCFTNRSTETRTFRRLIGACHEPSVTGKMRLMKTLMSLITALFATLIASSSFAQSPGTSPAIGTAPGGAAATAPTGQPNPEEMMKQMMEMSKLNENHKLLADMNGSWDYTIKMWMSPDPNAQ